MNRAQKITEILKARRPMAQRTDCATATLNEIGNKLGEFGSYIPRFSEKLDTSAAEKVRALLPESNSVLSELRRQQEKLALLSARFTRDTLNIGVAGRARQGKSTLLQSLTGLSTEEIPTGDKGHCTGSPSIVQNRDGETCAEIEFHTEDAFLKDVIEPFFGSLRLGIAPSSLREFELFPLPAAASSDLRDPTTAQEQLKKLRHFHQELPNYRNLLGAGKRTIKREDIREYIAQEDVTGKIKFPKWIAARQATIYCPFPQRDIGTIALADTPGLGDFISGAEERLVATVGRNLDVVLFMRMPPAIGAVIDPQDTALHSLIARSLPDLPIHEWSYFLVNKSADNEKQIAYFKSELQKTHIRTRKIFEVNCASPVEAARFLEEALTDIANNLGTLDNQLLEIHQRDLATLEKNIANFAKKAADALPQATAAPDLGLLQSLFQQTWQNIGVALETLVEEYRELKEQPHAEFCKKRDAILQRLESEPPPGLPDAAQIQHDAATKGLQIWHGDELHRLRVSLSQAFEPLDMILDEEFDKLREKVAKIFQSTESGRLSLAQTCAKDALTDLTNRWAGHEKAEPMQRAVDLLLGARLPFRSFIQPRVRASLDVLDGKSDAGKDFGFTPGDKAHVVREKLELAWERACFACRNVLNDLEKEPSMSLFATIEDFADAILRSGGSEHAKDQWRLFYSEQRNEVWPDRFGQLEADTRLRREWESAVITLKNASQSLTRAFQGSSH